MTTKIKSGLIADNAIVSAHISSGAISSAHLSSIDTDNVSEGSSNLYFTTARARTSLSVTDSGGDGSLAYDNSTGVITYTGPSAAEVRAHFSAGTNTTYSTGQFSISDSTIRSKFSVTDSGGDGSLAYSNGVITYTGPSATEVRAHLSAGTGVTYSSGAISIGQSVATTASPTFADINVTGNINVTGDLNTVSVTDLDVTDQTITLGAGQNEASSGGSGIVVDGSGASLLWDESNDEFDFNKGINVTGNLHAGDGTDINMDGSGNGQLEVDGDGYTGAIALNGSAMHIYHNSSSRDLVLGTNEIARLSISGTGGFNFESNPVQGITTLSSGAITSSGASSFTDLAIGGAADSNYDLKVYGLSRFQGTANFVSSGNVIQVGGQTILDASKNLSNIGTISSGAITATEVNISNGDLNFTKVDGIGINAKESLAITIDSDNNDSSRVFSILDGSGSTLMQITDTGNATFLGNVVAGQNVISASGAPLVLSAADGGSNIELYANGTAFIDATTTSFRGTNGSGTGNISAGLVTSVGGVVNTNTGSNPFYVTRSGATDQALKIYTDDASVWFESIQDESLDNYGNFIFVMDAGTTEPFFDVRKGTASSGSKFRVDGSGNVGIGNDAPAHRLHIQGATTDQARVRVSNSSTGQASLDLNNTEGYFRTYTDGGEYMIYDQTDGEERLRIDTSGNVGIGVAPSVGKLHVAGNIYSTGSVQGGSALIGTSNSLATFGSNNSSTGISISRDTNASSYPDIVVDGTGKVGIGTAGPGQKLTIARNQATTFTDAFLGLKATDVIDTTGRTGISLATSTVNNYGVTLNGIRHGSTSGEPRFGINMHNNSSGGLEALSIRASGNVGIGVTSPNHKLEVAGNAMLSTTDGFMYLSNVGTGNSGIYVRGIGGSNILRSHSTGQFTWEVNGGEKMRINSAGQIQATSGAVSSPTFSFIGDTNTGMTRPTGDTLQFITGGVERLRLGNGQMLVNDAETNFNAGKSIVYGGGGTGQNGGTVHYNGPSREYRNVVSVHTAISANRYWHIKTNFFSTNNIMFVARVHGYSYGNSGHIVDIQRSGYAYAAHGQLTGSQSVNNGSGADTLEVYFASDNYLCFRHSTPAAGYYNGYSFDIKMNSPTGYNWNFEVQSHAINSTSGNHF